MFGNMASLYHLGDRIDAPGAALNARIDELSARIEAQDASLSARIDALSARIKDQASASVPFRPGWTSTRAAVRADGFPEPGLSYRGATVAAVMEIATWTAIGLLAATSLGSLSYLGSRIDALGTRLDARIDAQGADLGSRIDAQGADLGSRIDALGTRIGSLESRLDARIDVLVTKIDDHVGRHAG